MTRLLEAAGVREQLSRLPLRFSRSDARAGDDDFLNLLLGGCRRPASAVPSPPPPVDDTRSVHYGAGIE